MKTELIEILGEETHSETGLPLPQNFIAVGEIDPDGLKVYIKQDVYERIEKFASEDTGREVGSILIGDHADEMGKTAVIITDFIKAEHTDSTASTLTFTHETWDHIHKEHERLYPDKKIVGWQHTHPKYGIFLSNYDKFIQENFFNLPFQTAYVVDPIQKLRGFFQNENGKTKKLNGFYIFDEVGKPIRTPQKNKPGSGAPARLSVSSALIALLIVSTAALAIFAFLLNNRYNSQIALQQELEKRIDKQEAQLSGYVTAEENLQNLMTIDELIKKIGEQENILADQSKALDELKAYAADIEGKI
jgi:proteasome lid subunit RPN8/RPN11